MTAPSEDLQAACPHCGADTTLVFRTRDYNRRTDRSVFSYRRCPRCELIFLWPVPSDLSPYYEGEYYGLPTSHDAVRTNAALERYKIDLVRRYVDTGRLLEIGPAWGAFAFLAKEAGFDVEVIERDETCCNFLRDVIQVVVHRGDDPIAILSELPAFRVIALWQVIEHLVDPWATLDAIVNRLEPGGILVVATPNPQAFQFQLFGRRWTHVDAPRHTELIPRQLLSDWAASRSLRTVLATTCDPGSLSWNAFGWRESLGGFFNSRIAREGAYRFGTALARVMSPIDGHEGLGCSYTIVLEKPGPGSSRVPHAV